MPYRNVTGLRLRSYTTAQLDDLVVRYGPGGTGYDDAIAPGSLVHDSTTNTIKVFNGTAFVDLGAAAPPP